MFEHDMQESSNNKVEVNDVDPEVLKEMLTYMYTDQVPNMKSVACSLLYVADKYQLDQLKALLIEVYTSAQPFHTIMEKLILSNEKNWCKSQRTDSMGGDEIIEPQVLHSSPLVGHRLLQSKFHRINGQKNFWQ